MGNCSIQEKMFTGMSGLQTSARSMTDVACVFEFFLYRALTEKIKEETNHSTQQFEDSGGNIFSKEYRVKDWQPMTAKEKCTVLKLIMHMGFASKLSLRWNFSLNKLVATPMCGSFISMDKFECICCFKYYTSKDTYEGP
jgi:hypothetical protein